MGVFQDLNDLSTPWRFSLDEWKDKIGDSSFGSPIHGLRAGYEMTKLGSAYRLKQGINRMNDGENPFSSEFIKGTANDQGNNVADAFKENWPVIAAMIGGSLANSGSGASSGATAASNAGNAAGGSGIAIDEAGGLVSAGTAGSTALDSGAAAGGSAGGSAAGGAGFNWQKLMGSLGQGGQGQQQQQPQQAPPPAMHPLQPMASNFLTFDSQMPGLGRVGQTLMPKQTPEQAQRKLLLNQSLLQMGFGQ